MKITTWNVNSVKARTPTILKWLDENTPDIVCMQEIKTVNDGFPVLEFESRGYNLHIHGQKSYNGVAILSKYPIDEALTGLLGDENDEQARYVEVVISAKNSPFRIASIYLPNGNPVYDGEEFHQKYIYKLAWLERLHARAKTLLANEETFVLAGDYNVIPEAKDVHDPEAWWGDALYRAETHVAFRKLLGLGLTDAFHQMDGRSGQYTFWDYQAGAWPQNKGIRIDHLLLSPQAADRISDISIDRMARDMVKPSDHVPVTGVFDF